MAKATLTAAQITHITKAVKSIVGGDARLVKTTREVAAERKAAFTALFDGCLTPEKGLYNTLRDAFSASYEKAVKFVPEKGKRSPAGMAWSRGLEAAGIEAPKTGGQKARDENAAQKAAQKAGGKAVMIAAYEAAQKVATAKLDVVKDVPQNAAKVAAEAAQKETLARLVLQCEDDALVEALMVLLRNPAKAKAAAKAATPKTGIAATAAQLAA